MNITKKIGISSVSSMILMVVLSGCSAIESYKTIESPQVDASRIPYSGKKINISIGNVENKSEFMRGIFSDNQDRIGNQTKTILTAHLNQSNRFNVLDRENIKEAKQEAIIGNKTQNIKGADYIITGNVTEFGRKEIGDHQLFGILGSGKSQIAYTKITLNLVNIKTSEVVYSTQGTGEYKLSNRELLGFGSTASYDSTLNGKVLDLAVRNAVDSFAKAIDNNSIQTN